MINLEQWRAADRSTKNRNAFLIALGCTGLVAFIWVTTVPTRLSVLAVLEPGATTSAEVEVSESTPVNTILEKTRNQVGALRGAWLAATATATPSAATGSVASATSSASLRLPGDSASGVAVPVPSAPFVATTAPTDRVSRDRVDPMLSTTTTATTTTSRAPRIIQISTSSPATAPNQ
jgi:hypothetical protein